MNDLTRGLCQLPRHEDRAGGGEATLHVMRGHGTLFHLSAGHARSDQKTGDGLFFDDLRARFVPSGNPGITPAVPYFHLRGHVHTQHVRRKASTWRLDAGLVHQMRDGETIHRLARSRPPFFGGPRQVRFGLEASF